ncbi:O-antigen ligase family protein [Oceanirhabdus sp. W0125-5]|uniref:O-antigen ligase family protein n=1 Tax=Oceanirhabdus sp. W0125-5 TaxID=2999116 RepID=UPI0022F33B87|nr:O-antigen ligase family protein [Oceanirhabdus sp. W0125-5]WBW99451.1 O-antigen ligase family protein [Oceanirhabdus sp. W0125-5]
METKLRKINDYLLGIFLIIIPFSNKVVPIINITIKSDIILFTFFLLFFIRMVILRNERRRFQEYLYNRCSSIFFLFLIALCFLMFLSISYSAYKVTALKESFRFFTYVILLIIIGYDYCEDKWIKTLINLIVLVMIIECVIGIIQFSTGLFMIRAFSKEICGFNKIHGTFENPNTYAGFLVLLFYPIAVYSFQKIFIEKKKRYYILLLLILINLVLTMSRNGIIGIVVGGLILAIFYEKRAMYGVGVLGVLGAIVLKSRNIFDISLNETRLKLWKCARLIIRDNPIKGIGNGNFRETYNIYIRHYPEVSVHSALNMPPHNSFLKVWSELGIISIIIFISILLYGGKSIYLCAKKCNNSIARLFFTGYMCSFLGFISMNMSDDLFFVPKLTTYFWVFTALAWGYDQRRNSNDKR